MSAGAQLASIVFSVAVFGIVFEMVRRRRLQERYALLWLAASLVLVLLAAWTQLLDSVASLVGIATPSNAFFVIAFAFLLLLLLHMTAVASQLSDETRVLAQRLALLEQRQEPPFPAAEPVGESIAQTPAHGRARSAAASSR